MNWRETLELKHEYEKLIKERSYVFQIDSKERAARLFEQPLDTYYHLPYVLWVHVGARMEEFYRCMSRDIQMVEEWSGKELSNVYYRDWVDLYRQWLRKQ